MASQQPDLIKALRNVALDDSAISLGKSAQACQQIRCAGGDEARSDDCLNALISKILYPLQEGFCLSQSHILALCVTLCAIPAAKVQTSSKARQVRCRISGMTIKVTTG